MTAIDMKTELDKLGFIPHPIFDNRKIYRNICIERRTNVDEDEYQISLYKGFEKTVLTAKDDYEAIDVIHKLLLSQL